MRHLVDNPTLRALFPESLAARLLLAGLLAAAIAAAATGNGMTIVHSISPG